MITIYNSNLDFDLGSSNSITLSSTSNMVFKTNGVDKMSIVNNGISVSGNVVVSGLITSTGGGFSGIGAGLSNIPISAINELRLELNGGTTDLSITRDTLNARIVSEAGFGSNYTSRINSELNTRVDNTSNYVLATSNILIGRIINTSNYVDSTSNFLSVRIDNTSNYALATSNILIGRIINTSNYVDSTSNFLSGRIDNTSNYALATSNILIGRIINTSNYVDSTSNFLGGRIDNTSNYVLATSNILIGRLINTSNYVDSTSNFLSGRIDNTSNYVLATSNILIGRIDNTSNYVLATSNILIDRLINTSNYVDRTSNFLSGRIDNTSNYVLATSNILIGRLINTSNYVDSTSNFLSGRIDNTSNYVLATSNILIGRLINASNYVESTSNILIGRIINTSNYVDRINTALTTAVGLKQDILTAANTIGVLNTTTDFVVNGSKIELTKNTSNYVDRINTALTTAVGLKQDILTAANTIGVLNTITDFVVNGSKIELTKNTSNYVDRINTALTTAVGLKQDILTAANTIGVLNTTTDFVVNGSKIELTKNTSNYVLATSNILIGRIMNTSNYVSSYKPATAVRADTADKLTTSRKIANVPFDGSADISISYNALDDKLLFGNGLSTSYDAITNITSVTANALAQEQSDWTQTSTSAVSFIKNKPTIPTNTFQLNGSIAFYNSGNVGIGTNAPLSLLEIITTNYTGALLTLDAGIVNSTTQMPRSIGRPLLKLGKTSYSTSVGDYYGIGFGISPTLSDYNCAEIGTIITSTAGLETGDIIFSTRPGTNNVIATERMRITSAGNVGIGVTDTSTYKLNVGGDINISSGSSFRVGGNVLSTFTPTSANLIGSFSSTQFENVSSAIQIKSTWKPNTAGTADAVAYSGITSIPTTWNVSQIPNLGADKITSGTFADSLIPTLAISKTSGLQNALDGKQATITSSTAVSAQTLQLSPSANYTPLILTAPNSSDSCCIRFNRASGSGNAFIGLDGTGLSGNAVYYNPSLTIKNNVNSELIRIKAIVNNVDTEHMALGQNKIYFNTGTDILDGVGRIRLRFGMSDNEAEDAKYTMIRGHGSTPILFYNGANDLIGYFQANGFLWTAGGTSSDSRIKKEIEDITDDSALKMILAIEPKTYKYIDDEKGTERVYGFIAQQIRSVIPEATALHTDLIPNIMKNAICDKNKVYLDLTTYDDVPLNDEGLKINIIFNNGGGDNYKIVEVTKDYFVVDRNIFYEIYKNGVPSNVPQTEVFVKGYQVNNFHKLRKDYIFTLNVCATQELHRLIEAQQVIIKSHEERIKELERKIEMILNNTS